ARLKRVEGSRFATDKNARLERRPLEQPQTRFKPCFICSRIVRGFQPMPTATSQVVSQLQRSIARTIFGKEEAIQLALITLLARGHLLIEDVPGVGKTTLAQALAKSFHCSFQRIQFTSDLLPSDVLGVSVYNPESREFEFRSGPIFANVVLADEINRTTPRTQSALLE